MTCWASFTDWRRPARFLSPHGSVREALVVLRHDGGPHRSAREDGFLEELRGGLGHVGPGSSDLPYLELAPSRRVPHRHDPALPLDPVAREQRMEELDRVVGAEQDRKSTRLNSSHAKSSYAVF